MADKDQMVTSDGEQVVASGTEQAKPDELEPVKPNSTEQVVANGKQIVGNDTKSLVEELRKSFCVLETLKNRSTDKVQWTEIEEHFHNLETTLKKKFEELKTKEKIFEEKEAATHALLANREAAVAAKEQDLLDRVQVLKDAAVASIADVRANHQLSSPQGGDVESKKDEKVSCSIGEANSPQEVFSLSSSEIGESVADIVMPRPELAQFCQHMDSKGLVKFIMDNQNSLHAIYKELSVALESATDPARLVLDSLEGFFPPHETNHPGDTRDPALQGMRKSCIIIMEAMFSYMARIYPSSAIILYPETKQHAKAIADEWKPKLATAGIDATNKNSLEAKAFLVLLATFRIASEYDEEELCKLVLAVPYCRQTPELCRFLGLTHKMPGIVELLINSGKRIDAVHLVHAFQLTEQYPIVPLLKTYLKDIRRDSQVKGGNQGGALSQNDANAKELAALKAVIKCIAEYKLEANYPLDPLLKRVAQLDKSEKKRDRDLSRYPKPKKAKEHGRFHGSRGPGSGGGRKVLPVYGPPGSVYGERSVYGAMAQRYAPAGSIYQLPSQLTYAQQGSDQKLYHHPQDGRIDATSYTTPPLSYANYTGSGLPSSYQP